MKKMFLRTIILVMVVLGGISLSNRALADGNVPTCRIHTNPSAILKGEATTVIWYASPDTIKATLYPKGSDHVIKVFSGQEGWWWMSGITDSREYTLIVENAEGKTGSCTAGVSVVAQKDNKNSDEGKDKSIEKRDKSKSSSCKFNKHKKAKYKKAYRKVRHLKKHHYSTYLEYRHLYKKYKHLSSKERLHKLGAVDYKKYKLYKRYRKYKKCYH